MNRRGLAPILLVGSIALATGCAPRYAFRQDPAYATLPRVNLTIATHSLGPNLTQVGRDIQYGVEEQLAAQRVAASADRYDERAPTIEIDIIDRGDARMRDADPRGPTFVSEAQSAGFGDIIDPTNFGSAVGSRNQARIVEVLVRVQAPTDPEPVTLGSVHALVFLDLVSADKVAEVVATMVQRYLEAANH